VFERLNWNWKMLEAMESSVNGGFTHLQSCGDSSEEELSVLPRHTKVVVTGNNRTKSVLVGLQGVVKKAVGLGGWHWLVSFISLPFIMTIRIMNCLILILGCLMSFICIILPRDSSNQCPVSVNFGIFCFIIISSHVYF